ncbi:F-box protein SKIP23-like [Vicia villosa]|uniref:F-box protein SKIP23-like n=1 Tax=Vicia villosa TaxID=3911 RepID=UPI00273C5FF7|nr:F-box protein SKIP23-like [Vicia villosa]
MADWSELPKDLLHLISEKLNSDFYILRFRSVCSTWRLSIPKPHNHFPLKLPHFSRRNKLYNHSIFLIKPPATPNQQTLYRPWLVRICRTSTGKFNLCHPLSRHRFNIPSDSRVLDFSQLSVFNIQEVYIRGVSYQNSSTIGFCHFDRSVATFQREHILEIVTTDRNSGEMVMFHRRGNGLTKIPNVAPYYQGMCIFKGRPCLTDDTGRTVMIGSDLSVHLVAEPVSGDDLDGLIYIMVENESELLLVHNYEDDYESDDDYDKYDEPIDVFRLDQKEKKWLKLENLGDTVLFLGHGYSFAISASDLGLDNGNFVIYCNYIRNEIRVFPLDQHRTFPLSDYPDYVKLFWPPPE